MPLLLDMISAPTRGGYSIAGEPGLAVRVVNPLNHPDWDIWVGGHSGSTFFHGATWARVLRETYGFQPCSFAALGGSGLVALLPCMEVDTFLGGRRGVCLPFTDHVAPLAECATQIPALFEAMTTHGRARGWRTWECRGVPDWAPETPGSLTYYRHTLDLTAGPDALFDAFDPSVRRALRKAARHDLEVHAHDSADGMTTYYALHCRTRRRHGLPPQPRAFFDHLQSHVIGPGRGRLFLVHQGNRAIAGAVFLHWGRQVLFKFGASDEGCQELRPNNLVMWHAIESYACDGYEQLDLGRTSMANAGLRRYKLGWGTTESRLRYVKYDLSKDRVVPDQDHATGWHTGVFHRLPLPLLRLVGERLYRHLA